MGGTNLDLAKGAFDQITIFDNIIAHYEKYDNFSTAANVATDINTLLNGVNFSYLDVTITGQALNAYTLAIETTRVPLQRIFGAGIGANTLRFFSDDNNLLIPFNRLQALRMSGTSGPALFELNAFTNIL
jgi:hypothetical protein